MGRLTFYLSAGTLIVAGDPRGSFNWRPVRRQRRLYERCIRER